MDKELLYLHRKAIIIGVPILVILLVYPMFVSGYFLRFATSLIMWLTLAIAWNIFTGNTGYINFGVAAFFGLGAYLTGLLMVVYGLPFGIALPIGALSTAFFAFVLGIPTLRLRGAYFALATWAVAEALKQFFLNLSIKGKPGTLGIELPIYYNYTFFYYLFLTWMIASFIVSYIIDKSSFGISIRAIREDELAAQSLGVNVVKLKLMMFVISCLFMGLAGGTYAYYMTFIHPEEVFNVAISIRTIVTVLLGGMGTVIGPVIGSVFFGVLFEILWASFPHIYLMIVGASIVLVIVVLPEGIVGIYEKLKAKLV